MRSVGCRGPDRRIIPGSVSVSVSGCRSDHIRSILQSPPNTGGRLRSGGALTGCVPGVSRSDHIRSIRSGPRRPEGCESCTGRAAAPFPLGAETSRAGRLEGVRVFSGTAGTCRVRVRNPGALRGRLGAGVVAYVPRYGAYVTLSRAPRETALFPVHCCHSSLPGRYASAAYTPVCGGTTGNMPRIPGGGVLECCDMLRAGLVALRRFGVSVWFALVRFRGDLPAVSHCPAMARYDIPGVRRYASVCAGSGFPVWLVMVRFAGGRGCVASRHLLRPVEEPGLIWRVFSRVPGRRIPDRLGSLSRYVALCRAACQGDPGGAGHFSRVSGCIRVVWGLIGAG
jgi:hypothetical protein